jgi:threonine dehydratase
VLKRVLNARVHEVLPEPTPLERAPILSERLGFQVWIKREDLTPVFSFKLRGAYNRVAQLTDAERAAGVIAASAGNHAQGVAYACQRLGVSCAIVMPRTTPRIKVDAVRRFGAEITLCGDSYTEAAEHAVALQVSSGRTAIPPFDDLDVIAGQGTIGLELLRQAPRDLSVIFAPVGGGGLISGIACVVKELRPEVKVIGVEPEDANNMQQALAAGHPVDLPRVGIFADGVAVRRAGEHTLKLCQQYVDEIVTVSIDEICAAIRDAFVDTRTMLEPAGALSIAGLKKVAAQRGGLGTSVVIASGANVSYSRFGYIVERAEAGEHREAILAVSIPERRGAFLEFCSVVGERPITEFNYRLASRERALIFVGVEVEGPAATRELCGALEARGYPTHDLSQDEVARTHVRHMVGGLSAAVRNEVLYDFEFPERPGALLQFLRSLSDRWNISLFHYRNHGAAFGRVLCGMEVPIEEREQLELALAQIGFDYQPVTNSPAAEFLLGVPDSNRAAR